MRDAINLPQFVREVLDGAVGDALYETQDEALSEIQRCLEERYHRPLVLREHTELAVMVAAEWERREQAKREREPDLNADNAPNDVAYRAEMIDAGRGSLVR